MGLTADLNVSVQSLLASTESMDVTTTNIANQNTPGYARQTVELEEAAPSGLDGSTTGVDVKAIQSTRDSVLDLSINAATAQQNLSNTVSSSLGAVQTVFADTASGSIGSSIDAFFSALQQLSTSPASSPLRNQALTAAGNVAASFQSTASVITQAQQQADQSVVQATGSANTILQQIASTNSQISTAQALGQNTNIDQNQLASLLSQLSAIVNYNTVNSSSGLSLTTANGTPLVVGSQAYALTNAINSSGFNSVYAGNTDITSNIQAERSAAISRPATRPWRPCHPRSISMPFSSHRPLTKSRPRARMSTETPASPSSILPTPPPAPPPERLPPSPSRSPAAPRSPLQRPAAHPATAPISPR